MRYLVENQAYTYMVRILLTTTRMRIMRVCIFFVGLRTRNLTFYNFLYSSHHTPYGCGHSLTFVFIVRYITRNNTQRAHALRVRLVLCMRGEHMSWRQTGNMVSCPPPHGDCGWLSLRIDPF